METIPSLPLKHKFFSRIHKLFIISVGFRPVCSVTFLRWLCRLGWPELHVLWQDVSKLHKKCLGPHEALLQPGLPGDLARHGLDEFHHLQNQEC